MEDDANLDAPGGGGGRVREILDEEEREQATRTADVRGTMKALATIAGVSVDIALGVPVTTLGSALQDFYLRRKKPLVEARLNAALRSLQRQLDEFGDRLDTEFTTTDEFLEMADEVFERVARERDERKRELYSSVLTSTAEVGVNRSFYPTALKLLDGLAPIHVELLRELLRRREKHEKDGGEHNTSTRELAIKLHLGDLEQLRLAGLSDEIPHVFSQKPDGVRAWDAVLGTADTIGGPGAEALKDKFREWDDDILAHLQYMGKEGLVEQVSERRSRITQLSVRLLEWLREPED